MMKLYGSISGKCIDCNQQTESHTEGVPQCWECFQKDPNPTKKTLRERQKASKELFGLSGIKPLTLDLRAWKKCFKN